MPIVAPSILSANFANLAADIQLINQSQADWFHVDIMDGVFVPNISFGFPVLKALQKLATKPLDVHLMIVDPDRYINAFADCGASTLTVHYEACTHLHRSIQSIRKAGMRPGVAINPHTPANLLQYILPDIDLVCVMSVNPGFGGQTFIKSSLLKLNELKTMRQTLSANHVLLECPRNFNSRSRYFSGRKYSFFRCKSGTSYCSIKKFVTFQFGYFLNIIPHLS